MAGIGSSSDYTGESASSLIHDIGVGAVSFGSSSSGTAPVTDVLGAKFGAEAGQQCSAVLHGFPKLCALYTQVSSVGGFSGHILDFILFVLYPMTLILSMTAVVIGIILFIVGIQRLRHHHANQNSRQVSYLGTVAYFISGVILIQYGPILHMLSASTFVGMYSADGTHYMPTMFSYVQCASEAAALGSSGGTTPSCGVVSPGPDFFIQELTFSLLLIVGLFSFLRGVFLLIKLGEGGSEGGILSKALAHIVAGIIGVNAHAAWSLLQDMTSTLGS